MPREFARHLRVGAELQRLMNELMHAEIKDPRLRETRVSEVELSGDLGVAKIYFAMLDPDDDPGPAAEALKKASGFLRRRVGQELRLRRVPELRFVHDKGSRQGFAITRLIDASNADPESDSDETEE